MLNVLSLELRRQLDLCFFYKIINGSVKFSILNEYTLLIVLFEITRFRVKHEYRFPTTNVFSNFLNRITTACCMPPSTLNFPSNVNNVEKKFPAPKAPNRYRENKSTKMKARKINTVNTEIISTAFHCILNDPKTLPSISPAFYSDMHSIFLVCSLGYSSASPSMSRY